MNGVRLNINSATGMPMTLSWISQASPIQIPDAHQPTRMNQIPRSGQATCGRPRSDMTVCPSRVLTEGPCRDLGRRVRIAAIG